MTPPPDAQAPEMPSPEPGGPSQPPDLGPGRGRAKRKLARTLLALARSFTPPINPVFALEMRISGRQRSTYVNRMSVALGLLLIVVIGYISSSEGPAAIGATGAGRAQELQTVAPTVASWVFFLLLFTLSFVGPALTGGAICDERRAGSLAATLTTPLTSLELLMGKLSSKFLHVVLLMALALPLMLALRVFGGLESSWILAATSVVLSFTLLAMSLALLASVRATRGSTAGTAGSVAAFAVPGLLCLTLVYIRSQWNWGPTGLIPYIFSPVTLGYLSAEIHTSFGASSTPWVGNTFVNIAASLAAVFAASASLRRSIRRADERPVTARRARRSRAGRRARARSTPPPTPETAPAPPPAPSPDAADVDTDSQSEAAPPATPQSRARAGSTARDSSRTVGNAPVFWRELAQPTFRTRLLGVLTVLAMCGGLAWLYLEADIRSEPAQAIVPFPAALIILLSLASTASGAIATEREVRTWTVLLTTPLRPRAILLGKLGGALKRQWPFAAMLGVHLTLSVLVGAMPLVAALVIIVALASGAYFVGSLGVVAALVLRSAKRATTVTVLVLAAMWILPWVLIDITAGIMGERSPLVEWGGFIAYAINPFAYIISASAAAAESVYNPGRGPVTFDAIDGSLDAMVMVVRLTISSLVWCAVATAMLAAAARWFHRFTERAS